MLGYALTLYITAVLILQINLPLKSYIAIVLTKP